MNMTNYKGTHKAPPPSPAAQITRLFKTLVKQIDGGHHTNAIRTCDKIINLTPGGDADALQTKLFLLLQTGEHAQALELADSDTMREGYQYEKAYALYGLHRLGEAWGVVEELEKERGVLHIEAQLNYRQGKYAECVEVYNELLDTCDNGTDEYADILTNLEAAQTHLDFIASGYAHALQGVALPSAPPATTTQNLPSTSAAPPPPTPAAPTTKKQPTRLPRGVIPGVTPPPDPERWVKKSERTNAFRHRKGAGKKEANTTQGVSLGVYVEGVGAGGGGGGSSGAAKPIGGSKAKGGKRK